MSDPQDKTNEPSDVKQLPVGTRLKQAREARGLSLENIHEVTKVPLDALRAIEEGYTVRTLSPFYYNGFLKIYGQYLDLDVSDAAKTLKPERATKELADEYKSFFFRDLLSHIFTARRIKQALFIIGGLIALFLLFKLLGFAFNRPSKPKVKEKVSMTQTKTEKKKVVVRKPPEANPVVKKQTVKPTSAPVAAKPLEPAKQAVAKITRNVMLTVRARKDSWLRVKVDGTMMFQSTLRMGTVETWPADDQIEISGQNINELEFELNGKMIGPLGRKNRKAKEVIITKDGLTVTK